MGRRGVVVLGNDTDNGIFLLEPGDVVLLAPGVGHKQVFSNELSSTSELDEFGELVVMGSYPKEGKHTVDEYQLLHRFAKLHIRSTVRFLAPRRRCRHYYWI